MVRALVKSHDDLAPRWDAAETLETLAAPAGVEPAARGSVYGVILNSRRQIEALGEALTQAPYGAPPKAPVLYIKPPNTYRPHGGHVPVPAGVEALEAAATLAVVIGRTACRVAEAEALDHVIGYTVAIDVSIPHASLHRPAIRQRCRDGFLPIGPWVVERGAVADSGALSVVTSVNGEERGRYAFSDLLRPVARLLADVTDFMTLFAGDILLVGLPPEAPTAQVGDVVTAEIDGVGRLECRLVEERPA